VTRELGDGSGEDLPAEAGELPVHTLTASHPEKSGVVAEVHFDTLGELHARVVVADRRCDAHLDGEALLNVVLDAEPDARGSLVAGEHVVEVDQADVGDVVGEVVAVATVRFVGRAVNDDLAVIYRLPADEQPSAVRLGVGVVRVLVPAARAAATGEPRGREADGSHTSKRLSPRDFSVSVGHACVSSAPNGRSSKVLTSPRYVCMRRLPERFGSRTGRMAGPEPTTGGACRGPQGGLSRPTPSKSREPTTHVLGGRTLLAVLRPGVLWIGVVSALFGVEGQIERDRVALHLVADRRREAPLEADKPGV